MPTTLPEVRPWRTVLNRLWPLFLCTLGAAALAFLLPQVPGVATGFAIIWALAWRRQASAVAAIEERDGARFYIDKTSPIKPIKLVRIPGFRSNLFELNGSQKRLSTARNPESDLQMISPTSPALLRTASTSAPYSSTPMG